MIDLDLFATKDVRVPHVVDSVALLVGVLPLFIHMGARKVSIAKGVVHESFRDWFAVGCGSLCVALALFALGLVVVAAPHHRMPRLWVGGGLLLLGAFQVASGLGLLAL
jgi:hypothetical protein